MTRKFNLRNAYNYIRYEMENCASNEEVAREFNVYPDYVKEELSDIEFITQFEDRGLVLYTTTDSIWQHKLLFRELKNKVTL